MISSPGGWRHGIVGMHDGKDFRVYPIDVDIVE